MTATHVDGIPVVADEPTPSPITTRDGKPILWLQTRTLLLDDGRIVYGCAHCDYTRDSPNAIRPHLSKHRDRPPKAGAGALTLDQLMSRLDHLGKVEAERDAWKARAVKAERSLAMLRDALKG